MSDPTNIRILNVNDREANRYALSRVLKAGGFDVLEAETGAEALEKAQTLPELVVLDVNLPDMSGFEVARRLKADPLTSHVLILHVSAISVFARHRAEGLDRGADGYLTEPFEPEELTATINALLRLGRAEAKARSAAAEWEATFDALGEGLALVGRDGVVRRHNTSLSRILSAVSLRGQRLTDFLPNSSALQEALLQVFAGGGRRPLQLERPDQSFRVTVEPVGNGTPETAIVAIEDVTQLKRAEDALRFLSEAGQILMSSLEYEQTLRRVASMAVPALAEHCVIDLREPDGALRRVVASIGGPLPDARERLSAEGPNLRRSDLVVERALLRGEPTLIANFGPADVDRVARSETHRELIEALHARSVIVVPLKVRERVLGAMTLIAGASYRRYGEEDLRLARELARRSALAVENGRLHREAQLAVQTRDEFFSIASHELKNPLSALMLQLKLLQREIRRAHSKQLALDTLANKVDSAERNASRLGELVQELLDTTRIRAGRLELRHEPVDVGLLLRDVAQRRETEAQAANSPIHLETHAEVIGQWDRSRIEQVLVNLISNAVKYGAGNPIHVKAVRDGESARIEVRDQGIGIPDSDQERVFEPFERGRALSGGSGMTGLGLGLYITRKIVEAHGGDIQLTSKPGEGTTFTVVLPLAPAESDSEIEDQPVSATAAGSAG